LPTQVTTEDGYILSLQRMPTRLSGKKADKPPVLIQHGILFVSFINANSYKKLQYCICKDNMFDSRDLF
jgi:hypothetical protein